MPTLLQQGYGNYKVRPGAFVFSFFLNAVLTLAMVWSGHWIVDHRSEIKQNVISLVTDATPVDLPLPIAARPVGGGGGGGDRDKLAASKGAPPRFAESQLTPPAVVVRNEAPKLIAEPTLVGAPALKFPIAPIGDPLSHVLGPPSNGTGSGGGIGSGTGGGVGSGRGPGLGPGEGGGVGGGVYRVGGGVSAPRVVYSPDPEFSEEARKAKYQGTVLLWVTVGADGLARDIRIVRSVGMGLDEKAVNAVKLWRFEPARKDGQAVAVQISVEVAFRLY